MQHLIFWSLNTQVCHRCKHKHTHTHNVLTLHRNTSVPRVDLVVCSWSRTGPYNGGCLSSPSPRNIKLQVTVTTWSSCTHYVCLLQTSLSQSILSLLYSPKYFHLLPLNYHSNPQYFPLSDSVSLSLCCSATSDSSKNSTLLSPCGKLKTVQRAKHVIQDPNI